MVQFLEKDVITGLYPNNSVEDLLMRGFGDVYIKKITKISMRSYKKEYLKRLINEDKAEYCALYIKYRLSKDCLISALYEYSLGDISRKNFLKLLNVCSKNEADLSLSKMFNLAGYADEFEQAFTNRTKSIQWRTEQTNQVRYGGKTPMSSDSVKQKVVDTVIDRYGVENVSQSVEIKQKKKDTCLENYGVDNPLKSNDVLEKQRSTIIDRYGVDNISKLDDIQKKKQFTTMEHYGVEHGFLTTNAREHLNQTLFEKYGAKNIAYPFQCDSVRKKAIATCLARYKVSNPFNNKDVQLRIKQTMSNKYGVVNPSLVKEFQQKRSHTMITKYGVRNPFQVEAFKQVSRETNLSKYGVPYVSQNAEIRERAVKTKIARGTINSSKPEDDLYNILVNVFGVDDVKRQYYSDEYKFACDFYIVSRNMYIELNASWTHGGHWFNKDADNDKLSLWREKNTKYYDSAIYTWTDLDIRKRRIACDNKLNYIVFWVTDLSDANIWFTMNCPDGSDWLYEYSWLSDRNVKIINDYPLLSSDYKSCIKIAKAFNGNEFYKREIKLWNENPMLACGSLQMNLYVNRYKYLGKKPNELTDKEILRGLSIGCFIKGYSVFNNTGMKYLIQKYAVKSIYDPCAGWGERLVTAGSMDIDYVGCDINKSVVSGNQAIIDYYKLDNCKVIYADSSKYDATSLNHYFVFTCPPYWNTEIYTDLGAENLSYSEFLSWWKTIIENSISKNTKYFAYQINTKYAKDMNNVLLDMNYELVEQISVGNMQINHLNRSQGNAYKKTWDEIQVFSVK